MKASSYVPSFYFYKLAQGISAPYTSLEAYSAGTIDANGNIIKPESSIDSFEYLVIKLKKIFEELPYGTTKAKLSNYMATLNMFGEQFELPTEEYNFFMEGFITANVNEEVSYIELLEDMTTGGGAGPGPGGLSVPTSPEVSQGGVAGYDPILGMGLKRRKKPKYFDNCEVFEVCPEEYISFKSAKQWKDVPDSETKNYLQRFQRRNKKAKIGIKSVNPISGDHDLYWISYPGKDFINEEYFEYTELLLESLNKITPKEFHGKFKQHLLSKGYSEVEFPSTEIRKDADKLKTYHESLPANSFYVSPDPNLPHGSDAFVKLKTGEHTGIELKRSYPSKARAKKPSHHGMAGISVKTPLLDYAAKLYGKVKEIASKPKSIKKAFTGSATREGIPYSERDIGKIVEQGSQKAIEQKGDLIIGGHPDGVHVLSSSRKKDSSLFDLHAKISDEIGFGITGNIRDWGGTLQTGFKASRPTKESDRGIGLKTRVEVAPIPEDHELHPVYKKNSEFLK
jgi:hypothetical protein